MSSFNYDKKKEHEQLAKKALEEHNDKLAFHHTCQAAMHTFLLAKSCDGQVAQNYLANARGLLEVAKQLKERILLNSDGADKKAPLDRAGKPAGIDQSAGKKDREGSFQAVERPDFNFSNVAGMDDVKAKFEEMVIKPMKYPEVADKYGVRRGGGVLLYGPPGTGKTYIARALAGELNASFYVIKSSDLISKWVGATEKQIAALFEEARKQDLAVIFIDEIDALMPDRTKGDMQNHENRMVNALLQELDGFEAKGGKQTLLFLGATNRPYSIDSAFLRSGRMGVKIYIGLPDRTARRKIIELFFKKREIELPESLLDFVADKTEGYNSADVDNLAQTVAMIAFNKEIEAKSQENTAYTPDYDAIFREALETVKSTVSQRDIDLIREWEKES